ncbi:class I mannose-6-phosphate isomerase [uncultured Enorma sp.]|uniref:class I mannose-6-phosphate isomerase n=1 Tax=uncultured Enorma sp. TaxID=1714346 RepID=UPI0025CF96C0|nr:class I mannose-6-phosphate isomerase [uncultured Enorma sp.]
MVKMFHIEPIIEARAWGGRKIIEQFGYQTDLDNIAEVYHVIAIPGHLDCLVSDTGQPLSEFYATHMELFDCDSSDLPVRLVTANAADRLSYHLHPQEDYGFAHEGMHSKIEGTFTIEETGEEYEVIVGHNAQSLEQFKAWVEEGAWDKLFRPIKMHVGDYLHMPIGTLHGESGDGTVISVAFSTNGDITYRLYDWGRNDPQRPLHVQQVFDNVNMPDDKVEGYHVIPYEQDGCLVYDYYAKPGEYVGRRVKVDGSGSFGMDEFMFLLCLQGEGAVAGNAIKPGETLFVPAHSGDLELCGDRLDLAVLSYKDA